MIPNSNPSLEPNALAYVTDAIKKNDIAKGPYIEKFETAFAKYAKEKHAVAMVNGTLALYVAIRALGWKSGEIILPSLTFAATADAVIMAGLKPVFADVDEKTMCLSPETVADKVTERTRAIITVSVYGMPAPIKSLRRFNVPIIEDAAEALGIQRGEADITIYSFFGNKILTTGEGGMATTSLDDLALRMQKLRNHGRITGYVHESQGVNARMSNIVAALGLAQLESMPRNLARRRAIFDEFNMPQKCAPWFIWKRTANKEKAVAAFKEWGVDARTGFYPLHLMGPYGEHGSLPVTEMLGHEIVMLPCYPDLTLEEIRAIKLACEHCL